MIHEKVVNKFVPCLTKDFAKVKRKASFFPNIFA